MKQTTNFGFKKVLLGEKAKLVENVFSSVANKYDLMNDIMSWGIHRWWKAHLIQEIAQLKPTKIIDVGGGTGDITFGLKEKLPEAQCMVLDINHDMLVQGMEKACNKGYLSEDIHWICANAEALPFQDNYFDVYVTAFCFRNVTSISTALKEAFRVLRPGGKFYCLEFSKVQNPVFNTLYKAWSFKVIPKIGKLVPNNEGAYQYLVESIERFHSAAKFKHIISQAGFSDVTYESLTNGIVCIHKGLKKEGIGF